MRPTRAALAACAAWFVLGVAAALFAQLKLVFALTGGALLVLACADALLLWRRGPPALQRTIPPAMALGERYDIALSIASGHRTHFVVRDHPPAQGQSEGLPAALTVYPGRPSVLTYRFRPLARGTLDFAPPGLECKGPLRLLERELRVGQHESTQVYPNFRKVAAYAAPGEESLHKGMHLQRRRGQGTEFHQLREYRDGDSLRQIDWKSVARRQQLISREYRSEQNQTVIFLVDCGRRMRAHDGELSLLDQSLQALLLLSYVALRQGESVGLLTFNDATRWLPPVRGANGLSALLSAVYDLESTPEPSDFERAIALLSARQRRRALVVLLTNLGDDDVDSLRTSLVTLREKHLVLVASMRDPELTAQLRRDIRTEADALRAMSVLAYLDARQNARKQLGAAGVSTFESEPADLPQKLVERYLMIKRAGNL